MIFGLIAVLIFLFMFLLLSAILIYTGLEIIINRTDIDDIFWGVMLILVGLFITSIICFIIYLICNYGG